MNLCDIAFIQRHNDCLAGGGFNLLMAGARRLHLRKKLNIRIVGFTSTLRHTQIFYFIISEVPLLEGEGS